MTTQRFVLYPEPNVGLLEEIAAELGIKLTIDRDIRYAEELFKLGIRPPGTEDGHTPKEMSYLFQILGAIQKQGEEFLPTDLHIYMNDRGFAQLPENTVPIVVKREQGRALHDLIDCVDGLNQTIQRERLE